MKYLLIFLLLHPALLLLFTIWAEFKWKLVAVIALPIDVLLNYTTAAAIWGWPHKGEWTISKRLQRQCLDTGRRGRWAGNLAAFLNNIKPGHI